MEKMIKTCQVCQRAGNKPASQRHTYWPLLAGSPLEILQIDFIGSMPKSNRGNQYLFTVCCQFTRWLEAFPTKTATAKEALNRLMEDFFPRYGIPTMIHSNRGTHFTANIFYVVCKKLSISHSYSPAYHPESNGIIERQHGTLKSMLKKLCNGKQEQWEINLPSVLFAMRTSKNRTTGLLPFLLIFGRNPNTQ